MPVPLSQNDFGIGPQYSVLTAAEQCALGAMLSRNSDTPTLGLKRVVSREHAGATEGMPPAATMHVTPTGPDRAKECSGEREPADNAGCSGPQAAHAAMEMHQVRFPRRSTAAANQKTTTPGSRPVATLLSRSAAEIGRL